MNASRHSLVNKAYSKVVKLRQLAERSIWIEKPKEARERRVWPIRSQTLGFGKWLTLP